MLKQFFDSLLFNLSWPWLSEIPYRVINPDCDPSYGLRVFVLLKQAQHFQVRSNAPLDVVAMKGTFLTLDPDQAHEVRIELDSPDAPYVTLAGVQLPPHSFLDPGPGAEFCLDDRWYRGCLYCFVQDNTILAVNLILLERYVQGVLAQQMPVGWPLEALKAQAIMAYGPDSGQNGTIS